MDPRAMEPVQIDPMLLILTFSTELHAAANGIWPPVGGEAMESFDFTYKWALELWNHSNFNTIGP